jgi:hypothetical protein
VMSGRGVREAAHADEAADGSDDDRRRSRAVRQARSEQVSPASV